MDITDSERRKLLSTVALIALWAMSLKELDPDNSENHDKYMTTCKYLEEHIQELKAVLDRIKSRK